MKSNCSIYSVFNGYWELKPILSLKLDYYRFGTDSWDWFGLVQYNILLKQGILNNIRLKLTSTFQVFPSLSLKKFTRH